MNQVHFNERDTQFMALAIELANRGRFTTTPNPNVGCVIVNQGKVVGQGWHQKAGGPHAEVHALQQAGELAQGATCYVTLEPCSHFGKTPPCAQALVDAKVAKVVAAMVDPNPQVSGRGLKQLQAAGIKVAVGLLEQQAEALNLGFIKRMQGKGAWLRCKMAASLDGKTALANGKSQWITSPDARSDVQLYRAQSCAVISSAETVLVDNACLNVRWAELGLSQNLLAQAGVRQPVRVIIDSQNRLTPDLTLFSQPSDIIIIRQQLDYHQQWPHFVEQLVVERKDGKVDLTALVAQLSGRGYNLLWLEAGPTLAGAFMAANLIDELILYQAPKLMGSSARSLFNLPKYSEMSQVNELAVCDLSMVGRDIRIIARRKPSSKQS